MVSFWVQSLKSDQFVGFTMCTSEGHIPVHVCRLKKKTKIKWHIIKTKKSAHEFTKSISEIHNVLYDAKRPGPPFLRLSVSLSFCLTLSLFLSHCSSSPSLSLSSPIRHLPLLILIPDCKLTHWASNEYINKSADYHPRQPTWQRPTHIISDVIPEPIMNKSKMASPTRRQRPLT